MEERGLNLVHTTIMRWVHGKQLLELKPCTFSGKGNCVEVLLQYFHELKSSINCLDLVLKFMMESKTMPHDIFAPEPFDEFRLFDRVLLADEVKLLFDLDNK